ncbi:DUF6064 family protein [Azohydromonas aeria]|uniref:DUF6064 family protein n=1 Tax=Azohydromonas aeria TaxID=2590212 RepID=UPI0018E02570|nr:DUF6064 family protein [Azohydromonas aeria]
MLPFTHAQFVAVFDAYNRAAWPAQIGAYALGAALLWMVARPTTRHAGRRIGLGLAAMWLWTGVAYHWLHFTAINRAAWAFGALFVAEGLLLAGAALRDRLDFAAAAGPAAPLGWLLIAYALLAYPLLGLAAGMRYPAMPMFGITPCPLTLFTWGLLLLVRSAPPWPVVAVPLVWSLVGGSAAFLLDVPQDWPLLASGLVALPLLRRQRRADRARAVVQGEVLWSRCQAGAVDHTLRRSRRREAPRWACGNPARHSLWALMQSLRVRHRWQIRSWPRGAWRAPGSG